MGHGSVGPTCGDRAVSRGRIVRPALGVAVPLTLQSPDSAVLALGTIDATLVALFFLFRVLPWSRPGPWRLIWVFASLTSIFFILGELEAGNLGGEALALAHQGPLFVAILCASAGFILAYLHGPRSVAVEHVGLGYDET